LLIAAEDTEISSTAADIQQLGVEVRPVQADLATYDGVEKLWREIEATGRPVDAIAINAGVGVGGDFARETDLEEELNMIQLNVTSVVHLSKRVLPQMIARGQGRVLITSSIAGTMPTPLEAVYGATKAFDLSFAKSLRGELEGTGVTVTALQPGPTNTNFFHRAGLDDTKVGSEGKYESEPADVAQQGYDALMKGEDHIYAASMKTKAQGELGRFIPDSVKSSMHKKMAEPKTGTDN
jgi:short-subunit dehydrogenase